MKSQGDRACFIGLDTVCFIQLDLMVTLKSRYFYTFLRGVLQILYSACFINYSEIL